MEISLEDVQMAEGLGELVRGSDAGRELLLRYFSLVLESTIQTVQAKLVEVDHEVPFRGVQRGPLGGARRHSPRQVSSGVPHVGCLDPIQGAPPLLIGAPPAGILHGTLFAPLLRLLYLNILGYRIAGGAILGAGASWESLGPWAAGVFRCLDLYLVDYLIATIELVRPLLSNGPFASCTELDCLAPLHMDLTPGPSRGPVHLFGGFRGPDPLRVYPISPGPTLESAHFSWDYQ
ncbi:hypothetical protein LIER_29500 [Lithospermum erythrorhizon]|uniref:Uncharacterized protein n=1 Tax=Lithospermum erythrorhizon TaxID=34254 RepID=A0AAV3RNE9_LITER